MSVLALCHRNMLMDTQRLVHNNPHLISNLHPLNENAKWRTSLLVHCRRVGVYHRRRTSHRHRHRHLSSLWVVVGGWCRRRPAVVSSVNVENGGKINLAVAVIIILWREKIYGGRNIIIIGGRRQKWRESTLEDTPNKYIPSTPYLHQQAAHWNPYISTTSLRRE